MSKAEIKNALEAPGPGEHTTEIMQEIMIYSHEEIAELKKYGVV